MKSKRAGALIITIFILGHTSCTVHTGNAGARTLFSPKKIIVNSDTEYML